MGRIPNTKEGLKAQVQWNNPTIKAQNKIKKPDTVAAAKHQNRCGNGSPIYT